MAARTRTREPNLVRSLTQALKQMPWLTEADQPAIDLAYKYAWQIQDAQANGTTQQAEKALGWLGPHLFGILKELGASPQARKALKAVKEDGGRLAELRNSRSGLRAVE